MRTGVMSQEISMQPRLYVGTEDEALLDEQTRAQVSRLKSLQQSIARRPETFLRAFTELDEEATADSYGIKDEEILTRTVSREPKNLIKEYFQKRDDRRVEFDDASEEAIYTNPEFKRLSDISKSKTSSSVKVGAMRTEIRANPEARKASDDVRRHIFGQYIGRVVLWKEQQQEKRHSRAS